MTSLKTRLPSSRFATILLGAAALVTMLVSGRWAVQWVKRGYFLRDYIASQWWVDYSGGFVRRGLPGELLRQVIDGDVSAQAVDFAGFVVGLGGLVASCYLTWRVAKLVSTRTELVVALAVLVATPFTLATYVRQVGLYDGFGFIAAAVIVAVHRRFRLSVSVIVAVLASTLATLCQEFLALYLAPLVFLLVSGQYGGRGNWTGAVAAAPMLGAAAACIWVRPEPEALAGMERAAQAARPDIATDPRNAVDALRQVPADSIRHLTEMAPYTIPLATLIYGGAFVLAFSVLWRVLGRPHGLALTLVYLGLVAMTMSFVGIDFRRWWAMAYVFGLAATIILKGKEMGAKNWSERPPVVTPLIVCAVFFCCVAQLAPFTAAGFDPVNGNTTIHLR